MQVKIWDQRARAASAYSLKNGDPKFSEIQYWLICGVMAFSHQVYTVHYHMSACVNLLAPELFF